ncbi:antibiotic biosynthesis monooxygenase family protein [Chitinophaga pinensis]|uniref:Antibiotic biosynthesis monooxygenase n=1 Tax=Chitinophaga pinensis (strain ATCC 43595 / DSM 2588 / LMG 13176 / NBRC 15968 / NCIMB 11800 / UQM 2034) TaxID=485918 RepID=A0A979G3E5_CHIPD|nr:antibiotic biosynthesis monooxygenase family protein [Chitinophaga pinensis]ACU60011.1 Antibiotic biosynthesis monooxygenase [Chitinophaga pinensis DSM 2588]
MNQAIVLINVFTVAPENQLRLIDLLTKATEESVKFIEGFIAATLHKSVDGTKVTMYAQWRSREDYENMRKNAVASPYLEEALQFAQFDMGMYEIVRQFEAEQP